MVERDLSTLVEMTRGEMVEMTRIEKNKYIM